MQHLLAVGAHAERHEQRDRGRPSVEPDTRDCAWSRSQLARIGSSASERAFQASQSPFVLRQDAPDHVLADRHQRGVGRGLCTGVKTKGSKEALKEDRDEMSNDTPSEI